MALAHRSSSQAGRLFFAFSLALSLALGRAAQGPALTDTNSPAASLSLLESPSPWTEGIEVRSAAGYKENLLLSHHNLENSVLSANGVDLSLGRLPVDTRELYFLLSADDVRYPDGKKVDHEDTVFGLAQFKWQSSARWRLGMDARYAYQDQVVDTSITETNLTTVVRGHAAALLPNVRYNLGVGRWLELSGAAQRQYFQKPLDDFWEGGPKLSLGRDYGYRSSVVLAFAWNWRAHDTRPQIALNGVGIDGTHLWFRQQDLGLTWRHHWDAQRRWRTSVRLAIFWNEDNGTGFYDYQRYVAAPQLRYVAGNWEVKTEARLAYYEFDRQTVSGSPSDPRLRHKTTFSGGLRGERKLGQGLKLFAELEYEKALSNRQADQYHATRGVGGVSWEF